MRVGIVGASNCILDGNFVDLVRHTPLTTQVGNMSLGGSTTVLLPYAHLRYDLDGYDVIIIDTMINEYLETRGGGYNAATGMKMLRTFVGDLHKKGKEVIFTIMPHKRSLMRDEYDFHALYSRAAKKLGCHVIDVTQAAIAAVLKGVPIDQLWQDETHITPALHRVVAHRVLSLLQTFQDNQAFQAGATSLEVPSGLSKLAAAAEFVPDGEPYPVMARHSSLCQPRYSQLPINTPITFYAPMGCVYGIAYNSIQFAGDVHIESDVGAASVNLHDPDVETLTRKPGFDFRHRVIPFDQVRTPDGSALTGTVTFIPMADSPAKVAEVECLYGGPLAALPVPNTEGYFALDEELALITGQQRQVA
ncbi:MAG: SGNH/GDSL hydrolase family protein [Sphingomonadales bacterium]